MKSIKKLLRPSRLVAAAALLLGVTPALGVSVTVLVGSGGLKFVPATSAIPVNGSVIWSWSGNFHSTTSGNPPGTPDNLWNSGVNNSPHLFTNTFNSAGNFPYYCSIHYGSGMVGNILVTNPAVPPLVTITNPASGSVLSAPASFSLAASASVASGSITNVQFFQGSTSLASIATPPFMVPVNSLAAAAYTFSAVATADSGLTSTNSISLNVINPGPLVITSPVLLNPGLFQFTYTSDPGLSYVVEVATDIYSGWTATATNTATSSPSIFIDSNAPPAGSFYRVLRQPNP